MNEMQIFNNEQFGEVRTVVKNDEAWFVGKDIAEILGYGNTRQALKSNVDDEDRGVHSVDTPSGKQQMTIINESGLYSLIFGSKLEKAKEFKHWVTSEVLPTLRRTGEYRIKQSDEMKKALAEAKLRNARSREAEKWLKLADRASTEISKQICHAYTSQVLTGGEFVLPLPRTKPTYSAGDIGTRLGISAKKVGMIAKANNLKTDEYGVWVMDKSRSSAHETSTFRYYENAIEAVRKILAEEVA